MAPKKRPAPKAAASSPPAKRAKTVAADIKAPAAAGSASSDDPLHLHGLFVGAKGPAWEAPLREVLETQSNSATFIGRERDAGIVPVRELTFQALKPNPPEAWNVVAFGQNPYPRLESATGIAMFDNAFDSWDSKRFGSVSSMRCIIKLAAMCQYGSPFDVSVDQLRALTKSKDIVSPPEWFQAMLSQGVLLLNAALTVGGSALTPAQHNKFWQPVVERIVDEILTAKAKAGSGVVFAWWGGESLKTKKVLSHVFDRHNGKVKIEHIEHANPAAQGDLFCKPKAKKDTLHFKHINQVLKSFKLAEVDWLPKRSWLKDASNSNSIDMGSFINETKELHKMYLERLQSGLDKMEQLAPIKGIMKSKKMSLCKACEILGLNKAALGSISEVEKRERGKLDMEEAASVHLYTTNSLYRELNAALRSPKRDAIMKYFAYLKLLLTALQRIPSGTIPLYRGIGKDLTAEYKEGGEVTWWAVSSCTPNLKVAKSFGGGSKAGTLFRVNANAAVPIMSLSAYKGEEEYVLAPGTCFKVVSVRRPSPASAVEITLEEVPDKRMVS